MDPKKHYRKKINPEPPGLLRFNYRGKWSLVCGHHVWHWSDLHQRCLECQRINQQGK
jgi:uncharacterized membrane protein YagU involved in acid resistance